MKHYPIRRAILASVLLAQLNGMLLFAAPKGKFHTPIEPPAPSGTHELSSSTPRIYDFTRDDLREVFRQLARDAKLNLVVGEAVKGTVTMRLEDKSPKESMEIIAESKDLNMKQGKSGIYFISLKNPPPPGAAKVESPKAEASEKDLAEIGTMFAPAVIKFYDSLLDCQAQEETAKKIAKSKKFLFDALVAEGFTREEALRIVIQDRDFAMPDLKK